jgi:hypothetical protein
MIDARDDTAHRLRPGCARPRLRLEDPADGTRLSHTRNSSSFLLSAPCGTKNGGRSRGIPVQSSSGTQRWQRRHGGSGGSGGGSGGRPRCQRRVGRDLGLLGPLKRRCHSAGPSAPSPVCPHSHPATACQSTPPPSSRSPEPRHAPFISSRLSPPALFSLPVVLPPRCSTSLLRQHRLATSSSSLPQPDANTALAPSPR